MRKEQINHRICRGWLLLFHAEVLDERIFHRLYSASQRAFGSAKAYFDHIENDLRRTKESKDKSYQSDLQAEANDWFNHSQISVAMRGKSSGSKFSTYLS